VVRLDENGEVRAGAMSLYKSNKKGGGKKVIVGEDGGEDEWIWCVEQ
jgi:hypothetical protein